MSAETVFVRGISKLKFLARVHRFRRTLERVLVIYLGIYTIVHTVEKIGFSFIPADSFFYLISIGIALLLSLLYGYIKKEDFISRLIEIDSRLKLQDRLSTAYEYQKFRKSSVFSNLLMADANSKLGQLSQKQIFPLKCSYLHFTLAIMICANIFFHYTDPVFNVSIPTTAEQIRLKKISRQLNNYVALKSKALKRIAEKSPFDHYKELKKIAGRIDHRLSYPDEVFATLNHVLSKIQGEQAYFVQRLGARLETVNLRNLFGRDIIEPGKISLNDLKKLNLKSNWMGNDQATASIHRDLGVLEEYRQLEKFIHRIIDELKGSELDYTPNSSSETAKERADTERDQTLLPHKHGETLSAEDQESIDEAADERSSSAARDEKSKARQQHKYGETQSAEGQGGIDESADGRSSSAAGDEKSKALNQPAHELEKLKGPVFKDRGIASQDEIYRVYIRSLAALKGSKLTEEDIVRPYRKEIESILKKEDIPLNYREYIKNYFLLIGLNPEARPQ